MTLQSDYIVYVDESGDHGLSSMDPNYSMFVLAFCVFEKSEYARHVTPALQEFKFRHFGHDMVVLHEHEIRKASGPFNILLNPKRREPFMQDLNDIVSTAPFTLFAAAIHKDQFQARYGNEGHNLYHVAVTSCLEALHKFLPAADDEAVTHVVFEARGKREDNELELEFRRVCDGANSSGVRFPFQIVFASKQSNSCGLQLADLVARPVGRKLLKPEQDNRAWDILKPKFHSSEDGEIEGNGLFVFP